MKTLAFYLLFLAAAAAASPPFVVHGHRGAAALRPENTIASFEQAIRDGADYIEMDVAVTSDNVLVISHDPVINPAICTGAGGSHPIHELTFGQVRQYDCGSLPSKAFPGRIPVPGARIPTLDEVLDLAKSSAIKFNIEIKSSPNWVNYTLPPDELSRAVVDAVRKHKLEKRVLLQSFDFRLVKAVRAIAPDLDVAALYGPGERTFVDIAQETGVRIVTPLYTLVTPEKLKAAHDAGIKVIPWTVDKQEDWDRLIDMGVDGIITNDPGALVRHLKDRGAARSASTPAGARVYREDIEWLDVWLPNTNDHDLPRVLLIGDSITRGYGRAVEMRLQGKAYVGRLATSKSLGDPALVEEVSMVLRQQSFDVIHFNNGMHGDRYSEAEYGAALPVLLAAIRQNAPRARLILATTTDVRTKNGLTGIEPKTARIVKRNGIVAGVARREGIPVNDLFAAVSDHPEYHAPDGVHFNDAGGAILAAQVAAEVEKLLPSKVAVR